MTKLDISLCMIMKDEEMHIDRCLSSIHHLVSEIIIADTGSHDKSIHIAQQYGAQILHVPWEHDFAKARNHVMKHATCSWILVLDADEEVDNWEPEELTRLLNNLDNHGYFISLRSYVGHAINNNYVTDAVCRLFRNDNRITFCDRIHESIAPSIWELPQGHIAFSTLSIRHYGYLQGEMIRKDKSQRNLAMIQDSLQQQPDYLPLHYALGSEYYEMGNYESSVHILAPLLQQVPTHSGYTSDLYLKSAYALRMCGELKQAETILIEGARLFPDFADLLESYALLLVEQRRYSQSYDFLQKALQVGVVPVKYSSSSGTGTYRTHWIAGRVCEQMLQFEEALTHYERSLTFRSDYIHTWKSFVPLCLLSNQIPRLLLVTEQYSEIFTEEIFMFLTPSALNSRSIPWITQLIPQLPTEPLSIIESLISDQQHDDHLESLNRLEGLLLSYPNHPMILSYLWAITYESGDPISAMRWLNELTPDKPDMNLIQQRLEGDVKSPLNRPIIEYCVQLLVQTGAWNTLLKLFLNSKYEICWATLPNSILAGLLQAPHPFLHHWCHIFTQQTEHSTSNTRRTEETQDSDHIAEWLFYVSITQACGETPRLNERTETILRQSSESVPLVALAYYNLLLCTHTYSSSLTPTPTGSLIWPLLFRAYMGI